MFVQVGYRAKNVLTKEVKFKYGLNYKDKRPVVSRTWGGRQQGTTKKVKGHFGELLELFYPWTGIVVTAVDAFIKIQRTAD